jgi:hypothetical protein
MTLFFFVLYSGNFLKDNNISTVWMNGGNTSGVGEWFSMPISGTKLHIRNDHAGDLNLWGKYSRAKKIRMYNTAWKWSEDGNDIIGGEEFIFELEDTAEEQTIELPFFLDNEAFATRFEILEVYPGSAFENTVIAEVRSSWSTPNLNAYIDRIDSRALEEIWYSDEIWEPAVFHGESWDSMVEPTPRKKIECMVSLDAVVYEERGDAVPDYFFSDVKRTDSAYESLAYLWTNMLVHGDEKTRYARLNDSINRAEIAKIITHARGFPLEISQCTQSRFSDTSPVDWYNQYIEHIADAGIVSGHPDGTFKPEQNVTLAQMYKILALSFGYVEKEPQSKSWQKWYTPYKKALSSEVDIPASIFNLPMDKELTRGETFVFIAAVMKENGKQTLERN